MGCTGSKQSRKSAHGVSPYIRTQSLPITFANYEQSVTLKSTTLGSLDLDPNAGAVSSEEMMKNSNDKADGVQSWAEMIEKHCKWAPLTPIKTPPNEPEVINVWELMEGLEDASPIRQSGIDRSLSLDASRDANEKSKSAIRELDPEIIYAYLSKREIPKFTGLVRQRIDAFQERINAKRAKVGPPGGGNRVVLYFTSLRGVRKTFEDCWDTKVILQSYGVVIDERDMAMHGGYKDELKGVLGGRFTGKLPQVFADGRHLGGAEEVKQMHEGGKLGKALGSCESLPVKKGVPGQEPCSSCGGMKFVPCETCSGSCKVFVSEDGEEENGGFVRCKDCNENGLIRCPLCC